MIRKYLDKSPVVASGAYVDQSAQVVGDVVIGADSSIWFNTVVRGDVNHIHIGERSNIQDGSVVHVTHKTHPTIVEDDVTVGHSVTLHGCTIRSRVLIGMGAIILDGAEVGPDSIVGAGALVTEGKIIPPGWLAIGSPAKPVRELTPQEKEMLLRSSWNYVNYKNSYMQTE